MAKKKQEVKLKEPVRIRFKQLANGNQSIYLDYYTGDVIRKENYVGGKRQYEFLKLYLIPEKTREDKTKNEATLALAKAIQSKLLIIIRNNWKDIKTPKEPMTYCIRTSICTISY